MQFDIRNIDLDRYNSLTKYPSIPTYHRMGEKGILTEEIQVPFTGDIIITEKIDGTNARIILGPDGSVVIGSREELLWSHGDLIFNPSMGIVSALKPVLLESLLLTVNKDAIVVIYGEVYGNAETGKTAKQYSSLGQPGFRLFDIAVFYDYERLLALPRERLAEWREYEGPYYQSWRSVRESVFRYHWQIVPELTPLSNLPVDVSETHLWLTHLQAKSSCCLDDKAKGEPEGVVIRTHDRKLIAKLRREDYARTLRKMGLESAKSS